MSLIECSGSCKYQRDGYCRLERVSDWHGPISGGECLYRVSNDQPVSAQGGLNGLSDVTD